MITGGDDYESGPFTVIVPAGQTVATFSILITVDDVFEENEVFTITIDSSTLPSRVLVQPGCMLTITIVDDDGELLLQLYDCLSHEN